ncbi:Carboxylesterase patB [Paramyrothecium foliicola]|nr:Carboxylesterase patB [Paramyrothecium foliicola]
MSSLFWGSPSLHLTMKNASSILSGAVFALLGAAAAGRLPQVDLGYEVHEALSYNETTDLFTFSNIRYAQAPVGDLRFRAPIAPTGRNSKVQRGEELRVCPQGIPSWGIASSEFGERWIRDRLDGYNYTEAHAAELPILKGVSEAWLTLPGLSEDCLFLNVVVPKKVFDRGKKAPVFVWFPGGGYIFGSKDDPSVAGDPSGLIAASRRDGSDGMIYVGINYRLGAFGWLAGPSLKAAGGTPNVGLHDQLLALNWVQKNIHLFGGNPKEVTVGGLSAGGGSIMHHITARGGKGRSPPFKRAFTNSPGFLPVLDPKVADNTTETFLNFLNVETLEEARKLPAEQLIRANAAHILSTDKSFIFGPAVDGDYVPELPSKLLKDSRFHKGIGLLGSYVKYEGGTYSAPYVVTDDDLDAYLQVIQPSMTESERKQVAKLYPGPDPARTVFFNGNLVFDCNVDYLAQANGGRAYVYENAAMSPFHGLDLTWIFNGGAQPGPGNAVTKPQVDYLQEYIANFVKKGNPNGKGLPVFAAYGKNASSIVVDNNGIVTKKASANNERCKWLQEKLYADFGSDKCDT